LFELRFRPSVDLYWLLRLTHAQYLEAFRGTAIRRAKPWMLRRNAAVALGNTGGAESAAPLDEAMRCDEHSIVRGHAAWGLGQVAARLELQEPVVLLSRALGSELDAQVREEIQAALEPLTPH
jgi:HEAT repeat protein